MLSWSAALILVVVAALSANAGVADLLITNARLIDGTGVEPRLGVSIEIRDGYIHAIGRDIRAPGALRLDVGGATVLPGLIDAHVHLTSVPGSGHRNDSDELSEELWRHHLRAYLACGVTAALDTGGDPDQLRRIQAILAAGAAGPRVYNLAPMLVTPGGYINDPSVGIVLEPVSNRRDIEERFAEAKGLPVVGVKVPIEFGFGPFKVWPVHPPELRSEIVAAAAARKLPIYVHGLSEEEQSIALDMHAHALVHAGFEQAAPSQGFLERLVASHAYVMTTLSIYDSMLMAYHPEHLDDPFIHAMVPALERETAGSSQAQARLARAMVAVSTPRWMPNLLNGLLARVLVTQEGLESQLENVGNAIKRFHVAGVPIVIGSDSGNWPMMLFEFHGPTTIREIELVGRAGLAPSEVLESATRVAAEMMGVDDEIGTVEPGKRADLVIVRGDPLHDLRALRDVEWTVFDGVARTPEQWLSGG